MKFENIMFRTPVSVNCPLEEIHIVVIDFGLAELFGPKHGRGLRSSWASGSLPTMAPEVIMRDLSYKCDIFSVGCLLYALLNAAPRVSVAPSGEHVIDIYPFPSDEGLQVLLQHQRLGAAMSHLRFVSGEAQSIVSDMLAFDEGSRPNARDCLAHPFFRNVPTLGSNCVPTESSSKLSASQVSALLLHSLPMSTGVSDTDDFVSSSDPTSSSSTAISKWWRFLTAKGATQLPVAETASLAKLFQAMDTNGDGCVTREELAAELERFGASHNAAHSAARAADLDGTGRIEWSEFVNALLPASEDLLVAALQLAFEQLDDNGDGALGREDFVRLLQSGRLSREGALQPSKSMVAKSADMLIEEIDSDRDGTVSFSELSDYIHRIVPAPEVGRTVSTTA